MDLKDKRIIFLQNRVDNLTKENKDLKDLNVNLENMISKLNILLNSARQRGKRLKLKLEIIRNKLRAP